MFLYREYRQASGLIYERYSLKHESSEMLLLLASNVVVCCARVEPKTLYNTAPGDIHLGCA